MSSPSQIIEGNALNNGHSTTSQSLNPATLSPHEETQAQSPTAESADSMDPQTQIQTDSQAVAFSTFHPFPRLPTEMRLKIWKFALPPSTTFSMNGYVNQILSMPLFFEERQSTFVLLRSQRARPPSSEPVLSLETCTSLSSLHQSRSEFGLRAQFNYRQYSIDWHDGKDPVQQVAFGQLRFGPKDAFFVNENDMYQMVKNRPFWRVLKGQDWTKDVKTLCIELGSYLGIEIPKFIAILVHFTGLEKVAIFSNRLSLENTAGMQKLKINWGRIKQTVLAKKIKGTKIPKIVFRIEGTEDVDVFE